MPGAGTKRQESEPAANAATSEYMQKSPSMVLSEFGQLCVTLPVSAAAIAVRDLAGLRCTVSFGNAPAVSSRLPEGGLANRCIETAEVVVYEDSGSTPSVTTSAKAGAGVRSAVVAPIRAQGNVVGVVQVSSTQTSAFSVDTIAELQKIAGDLAALMIFDAANGGEPLVGGALAEPTVLSDTSAEPEPATGVVPDRQAARQDDGAPTTAPPAITSVLPSDRPTPKRVWLIAGTILLVIWLVLLFVFMRRPGV